MPKIVNFGEFLRLEVCSQIVLPDGSLLIKRMAENAKIEEFICDILNEQKFNKNAQKGPIWRVIKSLIG